jgi:diguanylate cyclase (GGDEF)-like protein/PAS domain S-box-containing protein
MSERNPGSIATSQGAADDAAARVLACERVARVGSWQWDVAADVFTASPGWLRIHGIAGDAATPRTIADLEACLHPDDLPKMRAAFARAISGNGGATADAAEYRIIRQSDGAVRVVLAGCERLRDGGRVRLIGAVHDVSAARRRAERLARGEAPFYSLFRRHSSVMLLIDPSSARIIDANDAAIRFYGHAHAQLCGMPLAQINQRPEAEIRAALKSTVEENSSHFVVPHRLASGETRMVEVRATGIEVQGRLLIFSIVNDVTERVQALAALRESEERFRTLAETTSSGIYIGRDDRLLVVNRAMQAITGYDEAELLAIDGMLLIHPEHRAQMITRREARRRGEAVAAGFDVRLLRKDGSERWAEVSVATLLYAGEAAVLGTVVDVTEHKRLEAELRSLATTDTLTGLPNRRHFLARLAEEHARLQRNETQPAAVLMLDLDHFKRVNDRFGHAVGDEMLRHFAGQISDELRRIDSAGRVGGEEFALLLPGADAAAATIFAERLRRRVADEPLRHDGIPVTITVSIGIAALDAADAAADAALIRADRALYRAKGAGRNRVELATADDAARPDAPRADQPEASTAARKAS